MRIKIDIFSEPTERLVSKQQRNRTTVRSGCSA